MKLDLPIFQQQASFTCLSACLRMVLQYYDHALPEEDIASACQVNQRGTRFDLAAKYVRALGFEITHFKNGGLRDLFEYLAQGQPVIVALGAEHLPYANDRTALAVIVNGLAGDEVVLVDPALGKELRLESLAFFRAWTARGRAGLVLRQRPKVQLAGDRCDDLAATPESVPVHEWQKQELERRTANLISNSASALSWEEVKRMVRSRRVR